MMLVIERRRPEIDETHFRVVDAFGDFAAMGILHVVFVRDKQDVLRFQVRMRQLVLVQEFHRMHELPTDVTDLIERIRLVIIVLHKVENGSAEQIESDANVTVEIEPVQHFHAQVFRVRVAIGQFMQHVNLQFGRFSIFVHVFDDLQRDAFAFVVVIANFDDFAEGAFAERAEDLVAGLQHVARAVDQMPIVVVFDGCRRSDRLHFHHRLLMLLLRLRLLDRRWLLMMLLLLLLLLHGLLLLLLLLDSGGGGDHGCGG